MINFTIEIFASKKDYLVSNYTVVILNYQFTYVIYSTQINESFQVPFQINII